MTTGVRCLEYPLRKNRTYGKFPGPGYFFPKPRNRGEFVVDCDAKNALIELLPEYRIESYLGKAPWMVKLVQRGFLEIYDMDDAEADIGLEDLAESERIIVAKRKHPLTIDERRELVETLMFELQPENYIHSRAKHRIYADVLQALGKNISREEVAKMLGNQSEEWEKERMNAWMREAGAWNNLGEAGRDFARA